MPGAQRGLFESCCAANERRLGSASVVPELVYIDLNHWVGLSKAPIGQDGAGVCVDALAELRAAVSSGRAVVPLSSTHYAELSQIASTKRRADRA